MSKGSSWLKNLALFVLLALAGLPLVTATYRVIVGTWPWEPAEPGLNQEPASPDAHISRAGRFSAVFPAPPKESSKTMKSVTTDVEVHFVRVEDDATFGVSYYDLPGRQRLNFDKARDETAAGGKGELRKETELMLGPCEGREWRFALPDAGYVVIRTYVAGRRVYELYTFEAGATGPTAAASKFLDSFRVHK